MAGRKVGEKSDERLRVEKNWRVGRESNERREEKNSE